MPSLGREATSHDPGRAAGAGGQRQNAAMVAGNIAALDAVLADDYVARQITGYEQPKGEWLAEIREGSFDYHVIDETSLDVSLDGDVATLISEATVTVTIGG